MVDRLEQLESEVALLQDTVAEMGALLRRLVDLVVPPRPATDEEFAALPVLDLDGRDSP